MHLQGLQYEAVNLGPPKPPCNEDRVATLRALDCTDGPSDPELGEGAFCTVCAAAQPGTRALCNVREPLQATQCSGRRWRELY